MPLTISTLQNLKNRYPQFKFVPSKDFIWSSSDNTIYYDNKSPDLSLLLLHELSHALLGHNQYDRDIQLITMERQAWDYTIELAPSFGLEIPDNLAQSTLDSYRNWLHSRSICPKCQATGMQTDKRQYSCPVCGYNWRVNEARTCALRRYQTKTRT